MNRNLIELYVANKLAARDPLFSEAKTKLSSKQFRHLVMDKRANEILSDEMKDVIATNILKKNWVKPHTVLFKNPTIGQWISDVTGFYRVEDILEFFVQETQLDLQRLTQATIGGQTIMRPALIWMVERLEAATGRQLTLPESDAPLAYLGDGVTIQEIAKYFAESSEVISCLRRRYCHSLQPKELTETLERFATIVLVAYRSCAEVPDNITDDELLKSNLHQWYPSIASPSDWDLPIFWLEDELNLSIPVVTRWVTEKTTVADLVKLTQEIKREQLLQKRA